MKILGLDPATNTGYCVFDIKADKIIVSGTETFLGKKEKDRGILFVRFILWYIHILYIHKPEMVVYEQPHHRGGEPTRKLLGLTTLIEMGAELLRIPYCNVHTATLKKVCTGDGRASKEGMIRAAGKYLKRDPVTDDESDAVNVCVWARKELFSKERRIIKR